MNYYSAMQKSINYIESNLKEDISLDALSELVHFSVPHFYRIFHIYVGFSVMDYIKVRRLSKAAEELLTTDKRVIDLALDYQFKSQESFIRAFCRVFGSTPGKYRKEKSDIPVFGKADLFQSKFNIGERTVFEPHFVKKSFKLLGIESKINLDDDFTTTIQHLQQKLFSKLMKVKNSIISNSYVGFWYYKWDDSLPAKAPSIWYLASVEIDDINEVPSGMIIKSIVESKYAVFDEKRRGEIAGGEGYAYKVWLPDSRYTLNENIPGDFEVYPNRLDISSTSPCKIHIPIS